MFHPNVSEMGEICVNTLKRDWTSDTTLSHVFAVIRCLLIVPFPESSLNEEAGKLFMESYDEFVRRARLMTSIHAGARSRGGAASGGGGDSSGVAEGREGADTAALAPTPKRAKASTGALTEVPPSIDRGAETGPDGAKSTEPRAEGVKKKKTSKSTVRRL
jgi:ubiquitin-conjugating enzyme E2 S